MKKIMLMLMLSMSILIYAACQDDPGTKKKKDKVSDIKDTGSDKKSTSSTDVVKYSEDNTKTDTNSQSKKDSEQDELIKKAVVIEMPCSCNNVGSSKEDILCALDICDASVVQANDITSAINDWDFQCTLDETYEAVNHFGDKSNHLGAKLNDSYVLLGTGPVVNEGTIHSWGCTRSDLDDGKHDGVPDPIVEGDVMYDPVDWKISMTAPKEAQGFQLQYVFFSEEYDDYISSDRND